MLCGVIGDLVSEVDILSLALKAKQQKKTFSALAGQEGSSMNYLCALPIVYAGSMLLRWT